MADVGSEQDLGGSGFYGVYMFKFNGVNQLTGAHNPNYDSYCNSAASLFGTFSAGYCCLAGSGHNSLFTYDYGQLVKSLSNASVAGANKVELNLENLGTGLYFVKITSAELNQTVKMNVTK